MFGGSGPGAAACPAVCQVMGFRAGKKGGCTAVALQQPLDLTAPLGAEVLKHRKMSQQAAGKAGRDPGTLGFAGDTNPHIGSTT